MLNRRATLPSLYNDKENCRGGIQKWPVIDMIPVWTLGHEYSVKEALNARAGR